MKISVVSLVVVLALVCTMVLAPFSPVEAKTGGGVAVPVNYTSALGGFAGTYTINKFVAKNGQLSAVGTLSGTVTDALGNSLGTVSQALTLPVLNITGTCQILHLDLGPLDLTLLGLHIHLNEVVLDITAQQGGGLLGDLLCAVANLLNNGGALNSIAALLNQILGAL